MTRRMGEKTFDLRVLIKEYSGHILNAMDPDDTLVYYEAAEPFTTKVKHMDF